MQRYSSLRAVTRASSFARYLCLGNAALFVVAICCLLDMPASSQEQPQSPQVTITLEFNEPARAPVPGAAALQTAQAKIQEVYGPDVEPAKKPAEKIALANTVLKVAGEATNDSADRYALFILGRDLAIGADDLPLALQITKSLTDGYQLDPLEESHKILTKWVEKPEPNPPGISDAATTGLKFAEECAEREDYPNSLKFARLALEAAKKSRSPALVKQITAFGIDLTTRQKEGAEIKVAEQKLAVEPDDPAANMTLGRWYWFRKNDPFTAMPYLAKTAESPLQKAAATELQNPLEAPAQLALAEQWWTLAQAIQDEAIKTAILMRAGEWYELALPKLKSLDKVKTEQRIAELKTRLAKSKPAVPGGAPPGGAAPGAAAPGKPVALTPDERLKLALAEGGSKESEAAVERGLKWLAAAQNRDGGWTFDGTAAVARNGATGMALMPFLAAGYTHQGQNPYQATVKKGLEFLSKNSNPKYTDLRNGSVAWFENQGTMYSHGIAAAAMCDAYAKTKDKALLPYAQGGINFIALAQDPAGGGWRYVPRQPGDTSVAGWQFMALQSGSLANVKINPATVNLGTKFLDSASDPNEARAFYGYTGPGKGPALTAIGLLCRIQLGWKKDAAGLKPGVEYLAKMGPNRTNNYFNYYANNVLYQWGGEEWKTWNNLLQGQLVTSQSTQGVEAGSWYPGVQDHSSEKGGRLFNTAMSCLMLEVHYRYPRVLKE